MEIGEAAQEVEFDIQGWWKWAEERCIRAGELRRRLETDRIRALRMMESRSQDLILQDGPGWWKVATEWAGWIEEPEAGIRIGAHSEEVLLGGKPVLEFHHGRSTPGRASLTTQQPDKAVGSVVPDSSSIRIGPVIDGN
jgi:hypothetical protein